MYFALALVSLAIGALLMTRKANADEMSADSPGRIDSGDSFDLRPRGIRNNNPMNIVDAGIPWQGLVGNDGRYAVFDSAINGIRAGMIDIRTGFKRDGENTIREIITEWAPPTENDTASYIAAVSNRMGIAPDSTLTFERHIIPLAIAIVWHENGQQPYPLSYFESAYNRTFNDA